MKKVILIVLFLAVFLGVSFWLFNSNFLRRTQTPSGPANLTYWGLWEEENLVKLLITEFEKQNPNIKVTYVRQSSVNYRTRVQTQIREGQGPDVFRIHNSWLPMFTTDLAPAPPDLFSVNEYKQFFYPVVAANFIVGNQIFAAPIEIDGLALYYNEEILTAAGVTPPRTWQEFRDSAITMTVIDPATQAVQTAGAAMGSPSNVDHWSDILGLLMLQQPGVNFQAIASSSSAEVFRFFTDFVRDPKRKTWDKNMPTSTQAFAQGRLAYYFAPSWRAHELRQINPNLKFKVISVPQLPGSEIGWATFWAEAVSARSKNTRAAWQFIKFLTSSEAQKLAYQQASSVRLFGEPYSRIDLQTELSEDPIVGAFVNQGPLYKSWYLNSNTLDLGINDEMTKYFEDGINSTLAGTDPQVALQTVEAGVKQVLNKYTKVAPTATPKK